MEINRVDSHSNCLDRGISCVNGLFIENKDGGAYSVSIQGTQLPLIDTLLSFNWWINAMQTHISNAVPKLMHQNYFP